jgi:MFS transporter, DHA1 family, inner membrane transport protein
MRLRHGAGRERCARAGRRIVLRLSGRSSRPTALASAVLALALLGDSLLYAALPLHAATFEISLTWVGVLLSANRVTRLFAYPLLARIAGLAGLRRFTIAAAAIGAASTLGFAFGAGAWPLLGARIAWGIAFGSLSLATLAYATAETEGAGTRVGVSYALRELGPLASLTGGMLLVTTAGMRPALAILGVLSLLAIPVALRLPLQNVGRGFSPPPGRGGATPPTHERGGLKPRPALSEALSATLGFVADGLFPATIALLLARPGSATSAAIAAGTILALKRAAVVILSPVSGRLADRFGVAAIASAGVIATAAGAFLIGLDHVVTGSLILIGGAAVAAASLPVLASPDPKGDRMTSLARLAFARDAGAAAGPLVALALLDIMGSTLLYVIAGMALLAQSQQPPVFLSFFARVASFFNSGTSAKHAPRQSRSLR